MNAFGLASNNARAIFSRVARSVDPVICVAISLRDCPGFTLYCVTAAESDATVGADAALAWAAASKENNVPSSTLAALAAISAARRARWKWRRCERSGRLGRTIIETPGEWTKTEEQDTTANLAAQRKSAAQARRFNRTTARRGA
ncbi:hypothetical protein ASG35_14665 [Burkholderia sp. Leaf177]|nr:hypothetical protein ASG35_14665 [Burkholderia sp. Leaf177]